MPLAPQPLSSAAPQAPQLPKVAPSDSARPAPVIFCDTVQSLGVHNGVARISFIRLDADGKPIPALDLLLPVAQAEDFVRTLSTIGKQNGQQPAKDTKN
jgi:hypothetical protein